MRAEAYLPANPLSSTGRWKLSKNSSINSVILSAAALLCYLRCSYRSQTLDKIDFLHDYSILAVASIGVILAYMAPIAFRTSLLISWLCFLFSSGLAELQSSKVTDGTVLAGLIPYSDAHDYLTEASRVIEGQDLTSWGIRRPLADSYLAGQLYFARDNLTLALAFASFLTAAAIGLAAMEINRIMGIFSGTLWVWLLLAYYRRYLGELLSEHAGMAFGALSAALLVRAFSTGRLRFLCLGLLILSFALNARAGAFLVLPMLIASAVWRWRASGTMRVLLLATASVGAAFIVDLTFRKVLGPPHSRIVSNYHDVIYGTIFGGDWKLAAAEIPNYNQMDDSAQATEVYRRIFAAIKAKPLLIWNGAARNWSEFFLGSREALGPYSFFRRPPTEMKLLFLSAFGLLCSLAISDDLSSLVLAVSVGIVLSVPFIPPSDADLMRAYAATMPLMFLIPCFAFSKLREWLGKLKRKSIILDASIPKESGGVPRGATNLYFLTVVALSVMLLIPLWARFVAPMQPAARIKTVGSETELSLDLGRSSWIELTSANDRRVQCLRRVTADDFHKGINGMFRDFYPIQARYLDSIARPGVVLVAPDATATVFLAIDSRHLSYNDRTISIMGRTNMADPDGNPSFEENNLNTTDSPK